MYVITGASGNTGRVIAEKLLAAGKQVKVLGRSAEKLQPLVEKGAVAAVGDMSDQAYLNSAFAGATAAYVLIPPHLGASNFRAYQNDIGKKIAQALMQNSVKHVVNLSSLGAHLPKGTGPIAGLYDQEQRLNQLEANVLHLRPTYFMENLFTGINIIKNMGVNGSPANADVKIPMIASVDVANYAAKRLLALDFSGNSVQELLGERDLNMEEVTQILGKAIGKPDLAYVTFPYDQAREAMLEMGISASVTDGYLEMYKAINNRFGVAVMKRDKENTTPTSLEQFADVFARVYQNA
ncbi:MAG: NAD(P)H-binding protein [Calditrichaeota bacterium]|nr:NAD(P)H-binding protein [Calditrichota bacterium]MCB0296235.1 NAD(P)H-binding protein [Calditrichota bacterium]MCB0303729.1 NAD(P)H-binding protein [Calditrichota bacterium]MCB0314398.1 NAD(P)H-binding protein [Calditrichota bacterium]MCB9089073.1 NAD(P)H-binding protein [Calditrichia bacterium]